MSNAALELLDYRRRVFALYAEVRAQHDADPHAAHAHWAAVRDQLFGHHPQSPLESGGTFSGLRYYDYDPMFAVVATVDTDVEVERYDIATSGEATMAFERFGQVSTPWGTLDVFWLDAYGGGVFIPFRDETCGDATYGGGRYLLDTVKGADLGSTASGQLVLDFNFAYHPSCHYNPTWSCPLAPPGNRLPARIEAGEQAFETD
jgi:uncharacterized protein (DUF1684 family)